MIVRCITSSRDHGVALGQRGLRAEFIAVAMKIVDAFRDDFARRRAALGVGEIRWDLSPKSGSHRTPRWRKPDSNHRSREGGHRGLGHLICCSHEFPKCRLFRLSGAEVIRRTQVV
jgi:hypothetical protein